MAGNGGCRDLVALNIIQEKLATEDYRLASPTEPEAASKATGGTSRPQSENGSAIPKTGLKAGFFDRKKEVLQEISIADSEYPPLGEQQVRGQHSNARSLVKIAGRGKR